MREMFEKKLEKINASLIEMGALVEKSIVDANKALLTRDASLALEIVKNEAEVNDLEKDIESRCMKLLLQQQPVARDLRVISATLKIITDLERIGDQSADIANIIIKLNKLDKLVHIENLEYIPKMASEASKMVTKSIDSYVNKDLELANKVISDDELIDSLFKEVKKKIKKIIKDELDDGEEIINLLMIAKYLERIADHATNIAEWVIFAITGIHKERNVFK